MDSDKRLTLIEERLIRLEENLQEERDRTKALKAFINEREDRNSAVIREMMKIKWQLLDHIDELTMKDDDVLTCKICGHREKRGNYVKKVSECIYNGGRLERYVCPGCGCIFGPTKFDNLNQTEKDNDYFVHYMGYHEGDSTEKEVRAFYLLNPDKNGVYLNYGSGAWSKSIKQIRDAGYTVYGYEPYAEVTDDPYLITDTEVLKRMRFDGIYSNDLLEHLIYPVEDLRFMKSLLKDPRSKMSHSTSCFTYKHHETRFHTHFFTGDSVKVMCEKVGLQILECVNEVDTPADFYCYVFGMDVDIVEYLPHMYITNPDSKYEDKIVIGKDEIMFGPYLPGGKGDYHWRIEVEMDKERTVPYTVHSDGGRIPIAEGKLHDGINEIFYETGYYARAMELVVNNTEADEIVIRSIALL